MVQALHPSRKYKRVIQLELNEISREVVDILISKGKLPNFQRINNEFVYLKTTSETDYKHLEPWIQWCTAHTGKTFAEHQIFRLSDVHQLQHDQIWEALSDMGIESGIVGSMNIIRRRTQGGIFFPDPWSIVNEAYPGELRPLWDLIAGRVQAHATSAISVSDMMKGAQVCLKYGLPLSLYTQMGSQLVSQKLNPRNKWKLAAVFDVFLTELFKSVYKSTNFGFYTLFLNSIAHYQHHYWRAFDAEPFNKAIQYDDINEGDDPMTYGYEMFDRILGEFLRLKDEDTLLVILSGLSQVPYTAQDEVGGMNYYRLNNHQAFVESLGLFKPRIEAFPMMSRDWQLKYTDQEARREALDKLGALRVNGQPLFKLSENTDGYIFIETEYTRGVDHETFVSDAAGKPIARFEDIFTNTAIKSGHHTGIGSLWISDRKVVQDNGSKVPLTALFDFTKECFEPAQA